MSRREEDGREQGGVQVQGVDDQGQNNKADDEITIDFDQKDGSGERVVGKLTPKGDVALPDGTIWRRKSDADAWTPR